MIIADKAQIKIAELRESNNLRLSGSDELECYELIESDLKLPADATFTRSSVAYLSDGTQVPANTPRFEQGRFGKAIMVEEGTTNLLPPAKANCEVLPDAVGFATATVDTSRKFTGSASLKVQWTGEGLYSQVEYRLTLTNNNTYTVSGWAYLEESKYLRIQCQESGSPWRGVGSPWILVPAGKWVRLQHTFTLPEDWVQPTRIQLVAPRNSSSIGNISTVPVWWDAIQVEQKPYPTSFVDGTRSPETLTISTAGVFNKGDWTLELWYKAKKFGSMPRALVELWIDDGNKYAIELDSSYKLTGGIKYNGSWTWLADSSIVTDDIWYYIAFTGNGNTIKFYVNGELKGRSVYSEPVGNLPSYIYLGSNPLGATQPNSLIDDLRISSIARSDEEILAAYQSGQPLPVDEWTTYKLDFDDKVRITTQGQIICNELIEI